MQDVRVKDVQHFPKIDVQHFPKCWTSEECKEKRCPTLSKNRCPTLKKVFDIWRIKREKMSYTFQSVGHLKNAKRKDVLHFPKCWTSGE